MQVLVKGFILYANFVKAFFEQHVFELDVTSDVTFKNGKLKVMIKNWYIVLIPLVQELSAGENFWGRGNLELLHQS